MYIKRISYLLSCLASAIAIFVVAMGPLSVSAITQPYTPGQTLNPACVPGEENCTVRVGVQDYFVANSTTSSSTFAGLVNVNSLNITSSTTTSTIGQIEVSSIKLSTISGVLQAIGGYIISALVDLASQVTGILGILNGGTGTSTAPLAGQLLLGNASSTYDLVATSSLGIVSSQWVSSSSDIYFNTGNIGISAVSDIGSKLTIESSTTTSGDATLRFQNKSGNISPGDAIGNLEFYAKDPSTSGKGLVAKISGVAGSSGNNPFTGGGRPGDLAFYVTNSGTSAILYERMRLSSSGNLGIGNPNPGRNLDINSNSGSNTLIGLSQDLSEKLIFGLASGAGSILSGSIAGDTIFRATSTQKIMFGVSSTSSAVPALTIDLLNNVGIGTSTPSQKLAVAGNMYLTGSLFDSTYATGTVGQFLQSTATGTRWATALGGTNETVQRLSVTGRFTTGLPSSTNLPVLAGSTNIGGGFVYGMQTVGNYLYTIGYDGGFRVSDISSSTKPVLIGSIDLGVSAYSLAISGRYAFVGSPSSVYSIDVSNPKNPTIVSMTSLANANPIVVNGRYLYALSGNDLKIVDISNPTSMQIIKTITFASTPNWLSVKGRYAYVSGASLAPGFLYVLDIIDPINANIVGSITSGLAADQFRSTISDGYLYTIGRNSNSFSVINVTDPTNPVLLSSISAGNYPETFYVVGHYAYILNTHGNDMSIMDITNPSAPTEILPRVTIGGYRTWCVGSGRYLYVGDIYSTVSVYDLQGAEIGSLYAGILKSDNIQTTRTISVGTDLFVNNALIVGLGGIGTDGALSVLGTTTSSFFGGRLGIGTSTPSAQLTVAGSVRLASLGSGTVTSDANGNLTVSSDERLKDVQNNFTRGLADLQKVNPINYNWKPETGFDASSTYTGFSAQNVQLAIPEAVATNSIGYLTLSDRPILATVVNALKEIGSFIAKIENGIAYLKNIVVERLTIGSADKPTGITMYDEDTKAPYCLKIKSGVTITTPGECGNSSPAPVVTPVVTTPIVETSTTAETTTTPVVVATSTDPVVTTSTDPAPVAPVVVEPVVEPDPVVVIDPAPVVPETTPEAPAESAPADPVASPQE